MGVNGGAERDWSVRMGALAMAEAGGLGGGGWSLVKGWLGGLSPEWR